MITGAAQVDAAILVVAANDGTMPQTRFASVTRSTLLASETNKAQCVSLETFGKTLAMAQAGDNAAVLLRGVKRNEVVSESVALVLKRSV
jgi:translation elongation factor EF-Tu-like GTPase